MKRYLTIILFHLVLVTACTDSNKNENTTTTSDKIELSISTDSIKLIQPNDFSGFTGSIQYLGDSKLGMLNTEVNKLLIFSLTSNQLINEIIIEQEGPNAVPSPNSFKYITHDSIAIITDNAISFVNNQGRVLKTLKWSEFEFPYAEHTSAYVFNTSADRFEIFFQDSIIKVGGVPVDIYMSEADINNYKQTYLNLNLDLRSEKIQIDSIGYPSEFFDAGLKSLFYSRTKGYNDKLVYSFQDHRLFSLNGKSWTAHNAQSKDFDKEMAIAKSGYAEDPMQFFNFIYLNDRYGSIVYDQYRELYYRFAYSKPIEKVSQEELFKLMQYPIKQSILVFDKDLKMLDEISLPENNFVLSNYFISPDGLYISANNPKNVNASEENMTFVKINVW